MKVYHQTHVATKAQMYLLKRQEMYHSKNKTASEGIRKGQPTHRDSGTKCTEQALAPFGT